MTDQPLATEVEAVVSKQWTLKWAEVGKAALLAGGAVPAGIIITALMAGRWPLMADLIPALKSGLGTFLVVAFRDYAKSTRTVIKGQHDPNVIVKAPSTVVSIDTKPE